MVDTPVNVMILHLGHTFNVIWHVTSPMQFYNQLVLDGKGEECYESFLLRDKITAPHPLRTPVFPSRSFLLTPKSFSAKLLMNHFFGFSIF